MGDEETETKRNPKKKEQRQKTFGRSDLKYNQQEQKYINENSKQDSLHFRIQSKNDNN